jgi:glycosyltransferase involved in cell wall biosynthesis
MGVPCILTDIPGCREVVEHDQNGWLVPVGDVPALAGAIFKLLTDPVQAQRLGEAGRKIARERFDERLIFAKVKAEYSRLLQAKGLLGPAVQLVT